MISVSRQKLTVETVMMMSENWAYAHESRENVGDSKVIHTRCNSGMSECGSFTSYTIAARRCLAL